VHEQNDLEVSNRQIAGCGGRDKGDRPRWPLHHELHITSAEVVVRVGTFDVLALPKETPHAHLQGHRRETVNEEGLIQRKGDALLDEVESEGQPHPVRHLVAVGGAKCQPHAMQLCANGGGRLNDRRIDIELLEEEPSTVQVIGHSARFHCSMGSTPIPQV